MTNTWLGFVIGVGKVTRLREHQIVPVQVQAAAHTVVVSAAGTTVQAAVHTAGVPGQADTALVAGVPLVAGNAAASGVRVVGVP